MRFLTVAAVSVLALGAAACNSGVNYAARTRLDCPDHEGRLRRLSVSPDGKSCAYRADDIDVTLQLTPVSGDATSTLHAIEATLVGPSDGKTEAAPTTGQTAGPAASAAASSDAARVARQAAADAGGSGGHASADWGTGGKAEVAGETSGKKARADSDSDDDDDNDQAHVNLPGVHIDANDSGAQVDVAGIHIDANDTNATVRMLRDVRLRGHPFSRHRDGIRATFIAHRDDLPGGYQVVGYEASGPKTGPLTVAIIRSHDDIHNQGGGLYGDIQRLVRDNGGA